MTLGKVNLLVGDGLAMNLRLKLKFCIKNNDKKPLKMKIKFDYSKNCKMSGLREGVPVWQELGRDQGKT